MNPPIWRLAGLGLLCLSVSAQTLADDNDQRGPQNRPDGGGQNRGQQQEQRGQQVQQEMQQQQRAQQQEQRGQQQQMQQQMQQQQRAQQQELRGQPQQNQLQQRQQEFNQRQADRVNEQRQSFDANRARGLPQPQGQDPNGGRHDGPAIQGKPGVVWQTQPPIRGNNEGPRGNYGPGRGDDRWGPDDRRGPGNHGSGWGPGPQYRPGYTIDRFPGHEYRVPYRGQDFFYSGGYWYRPQGPRYVVVAPPYGIRTRALPDYATRMWIGGAMFFLAAGTYYQYMDDSQDYVVVNPPQGVQASQPQPVEQGDGLEVTFYPVNNQSPSQMERDRYECQRYAVQQSGFDPATATYAPAESVAYLFRQSMGNCLAGRGYQVE